MRYFGIPVWAGPAWDPHTDVDVHSAIFRRLDTDELGRLCMVGHFHREGGGVIDMPVDVRYDEYLDALLMALGATPLGGGCPSRRHLWADLYVIAMLLRGHLGHQLLSVDDRRVTFHAEMPQVVRESHPEHPALGDSGHRWLVVQSRPLADTDAMVIGLRSDGQAATVHGVHDLGGRLDDGLSLLEVAGALERLLQPDQTQQMVGRDVIELPEAELDRVLLGRAVGMAGILTDIRSSGWVTRRYPTSTGRPMDDWVTARDFVNAVRDYQNHCDPDGSPT